MLHKKFAREATMQHAHLLFIQFSENSTVEGGRSRCGLDESLC